MSKLICPVVKIDELIPIEKADRIVLAKVLGFSCIVQKDKYKVGDIVLYIPADSIIPAPLIEQYELEFLRKNGRVGVLKMKGVFSEGLILDVPGTAKVGENLADKLGITKWEPEEPDFQKSSNSRETVKMYWDGVFSGRVSVFRAVKKTFALTYDRYLKPKRKWNTNFSKYTDIQNIKHYPNLFNDNDNVVVTAKIHGCLDRNTLITTTDGEKSIGEICESKYRGKVLSCDTVTGREEFVKISNYSIRNTTTEWYEIELDNGIKLKVTGNHKIWLPEKKCYREVKSLRSGEEVLLKKYTK